MTTKEEVKHLWRLCFDHSEALTALYFSQRYTERTSLTLRSGGEVIAALQMLPYSMTFCGEVAETAYVCGACTHPDYRERGVMRELLSQAFARMQHAGILFATLKPLQPKLFGYAADKGFAPVFREGSRYFRPRVQGPVAGGGVLHTVDRFQPEVCDYMCSRMAQRPCCVLHGEDDFRALLAWLNLVGGHLFTLVHDRQTIIAAAVVCPGEDGTWQVADLLSDNPEAAQSLLHQVCRTLRQGRLHCVCPPAGDVDDRTVGMARIINVPAVLRLYAWSHPQAELNLDLTDDQLSANNGYYYLAKGRCLHSQTRQPGSHQSMDIAGLTERLLAAEHPFMSLMPGIE